ncbi:MAG: DEDD exnuclease domain-containing protein [Bacteroidetes bacterium QS_8_64_10]|nr:MAG: DEDD exnuclease domain-containing protein [Bacteroidetes bacterium QS_8_64_10]
MLAKDTPFVVVDTETTGGKAETNRVIELAAVRFEGGEVTDRFSQLVNPERSVPRRITQITGITTGMLYEEPPMAEVMPQFLDFLGEDVLVAHNMRFDKGFLDAELERLDRPALSCDTLCTLRLARRLLRELPSKGLSRLIEHYDLDAPNRHRALGDAENAARVLDRLLERLARKHDVETLHDVLAFQHKTYRKTKRPPKRLKKLREQAGDLPERPGVYCFKKKNGSRLYIGKAKNLRERVRSHLMSLGSKAKRMRKLVKHARRVTVAETNTELEALLLESRRIKEHKPRFNRAQRRYRNRPFLRLGTHEEFPRLTTTAYLKDDGAEYFGPVGGRRAADFVADVIRRTFKLRDCDDDTLREGRRCLYAEMGRCRAPCENGEAACYDEEVRRVRKFLTGRDDTVLDFLERRMRAAADGLEFEKAQYFRDAHRRLKRLLGRQRQVAASVLDHHAVVVQPNETETHLLAVRFGRLAETFSLACNPAASERERVRERLQACFAGDAAAERPERYHKEEVEEVRLLVQWMYEQRDSINQVQRRDYDDAGSFADAVLNVAEGL